MFAEVVVELVLRWYSSSGHTEQMAQQNEMQTQSRHSNRLMSVVVDVRML